MERVYFLDNMYNIPSAKVGASVPYHDTFQKFERDIQTSIMPNVAAQKTTNQSKA